MCLTALMMHRKEACLTASCVSGEKVRKIEKKLRGSLPPKLKKGCVTDAALPLFLISMYAVSLALLFSVQPSLFFFFLLYFFNAFHQCCAVCSYLSLPTTMLPIIFSIFVFLAKGRGEAANNKKSRSAWLRAPAQQKEFLLLFTASLWRFTSITTPVDSSAFVCAFLSFSSSQCTSFFPFRGEAAPSLHTRKHTHTHT